MDINLDRYRVFYEVATYLSFSKAANQLHLSQSAISQNIAALEKSLNTLLFIRSTKNVQLTYEGQLLLTYIEPALHSIQRGERHLAETALLRRGRLHIGVSDTICRYYLLPYLKEFHDRYPNIELLITNRTSIACVELLEKNMVDFILTNLPNQRLDSSFTVQETYHFHDILVASKHFPKLQEKPLALKTLLDYPILLLEQKSSTTRFLNNYFHQFDLHLSASIELDSIDLLIDMARIGLGITFLPDYVYKKNPSDLLKISMKKELPERHIAIVTKSNALLNHAAQHFISILKEEA